MSDEKVDPVIGPRAHARVARIYGAYTAFIAAAVVSAIAGNGHIKSEGWAVCLWTLSLPWLVSYIMLDYHVRAHQKRRNSAIRGIMLFFSFTLSNLGTAALLTNYSWIVAIIYLLTVFICILLIREVAGLGKLEGFENI